MMNREEETGVNRRMGEQDTGAKSQSQENLDSGREGEKVDEFCHTDPFTLIKGR